MPQHATQTMTLGTSLNAVSIVAGLGAAWGLAAVTPRTHRVDGCPFLAGFVYLTMESLEEAIAERLLVRSGDDDAERVTNQDE
jgi:hypothetical protein